MLAALLSLCLSLTAVPGLPATAVDDRYPLGDVNFSGDVTAADLTTLARLVGQIGELPEEGYQSDGTNRYELGDVDLDGSMDSADLTVLSRHVAQVELFDQTTVFGYKEGTQVSGYQSERIQSVVISNEEVYNTYLEFNNPVILPDSFADPEIHRFPDGNGNDVYWIYATGGNNIRAAYSTDNMKTWTIVGDVVDMSTLTWVDQTVGGGKIWAPSCLYKDGKYYLSFSNGDSHTSNPDAGINIVVSDNPDGPFVAYTDGPVVWEHDDNYSSMALIDQDLFMDEDGQVYMYYGGGGTCFAVKLSDGMDSLVPFEDGETYKKMDTLTDYMEAPFMIKRGGTYYLMYSCGIWSNASYSVRYATSDSPIGPFTSGRRILATDDSGTRRGPGHHSCIYLPENNQWLICYHRWDIANNFGETGSRGRLACIDRMVFNEDGSIRSVTMTDGWTTNDDFSADESNLALIATPSDVGGSAYGDSTVSSLCDGDMISYWQLGNKDALDAGNCWVQLNFDEPTVTNTAVFLMENGTRATQWEYQYSTDGGTTWNVVPDLTVTEETVNDIYTLTISYPALEATDYRLDMKAGANDKYSVKIYEWELRNLSAD